MSFEEEEPATEVAGMREMLSRPGFPVLPNVWIGTSVEDATVLGRMDELRHIPAAVRFISFEPLTGSVFGADLSGIQWAIVGGESGPGARPMPEAWVREIYRMCRRHDVAFFFKQWGGPRKKATGRLLQGRTYDEMPDRPGRPLDIRINGVLVDAVGSSRRLGVDGDVRR